MDPDPEIARPRQFRATLSTIEPERLIHSWREGCPVSPQDLRLVSLDHWGFDGNVHGGVLVVHREHARTVIRVMRELFEHRFPIERMEPVDAYGGDDLRSMEANNTSAFNCREVQDRPGAWSEHAFGRAVDINPVQNPFVAAPGSVSPPSGAKYANRSLRLPGMIHADGPAVRAFGSEGWKWGGEWSGRKDYQHFSATGR